MAGSLSSAFLAAPSAGPAVGILGATVVGTEMPGTPPAAIWAGTPRRTRSHSLSLSRDRGVKTNSSRRCGHQQTLVQRNLQRSDNSRDKNTTTTRTQRYRQQTPSTLGGSCVPVGWEENSVSESFAFVWLCVKASQSISRECLCRSWRGNAGKSMVTTSQN